jgi:FixJ family two-component response regulator
VAEKAGWLVVNEQSALNFINKPLPQDLVLVLDLMMPELDGIEVIRHLIKEQVNLTLILISGVDQRTLHSAQVLAQAYDVNVITSFTKPVSLKRFTEAINSISQSPSTQKNQMLYICHLLKILPKLY